MSLILCISIILTACSKDDETPVDDSATVTGSDQAMSVYNHAYNENYDADQIDYIVLNANDGYVLLDPFEGNAYESVAAIQANGNTVGAYISIGTGEDWRDDFADIEPYLISQQWGEWPGEYFINTTTTGALDVMKARIDRIADWGFDWVEFDNMDWAQYEDVTESYNLEVTAEEGRAYYNALCTYVHEKGMKCMAKNFVIDAEGFDGATYESYTDERNWWNESGAQGFLDADKLVVIIHYNESDCNQVYSDYMETYNSDLSFICESTVIEKYMHFNE